MFLHVLHNCVEYVQAEGDPDPRSAASVAYADGDGMTRLVEGGGCGSWWGQGKPLVKWLCSWACRGHMCVLCGVHTKLRVCGVRFS